MIRQCLIINLDGFIIQIITRDKRTKLKHKKSGI